MRFLVDEHVSNAIMECLRNRGHDVFSVRNRLPPGTPDPAIVADADQLGAVIVTWNRKHFAPLIRRDDPAKSAAAPNAGLLSFDCKPAQAVQLLERHVRHIEFASMDRQDQDDRRLIVEVSHRGLMIF